MYPLDPRQEHPFGFPSLKGFDFGLDVSRGEWMGRDLVFPSLKGFDFGLDRVYPKEVQP